MFSEENEIKFGKEVKIEIVQYGVDHRSWKEAASKYSDDFKKTAVSFGEIEGWRAAARKFGLGADSVRQWVRRKGNLQKIGGR